MSPMSHNFLVAAFCVTWTIQLGYLAWMMLKLHRQRGKIR
jgi:hypothetical protein